MEKTDDRPGAEGEAAKKASPADIPEKTIRQYPNIEKILNIEIPVIVVLAEKNVTLEDVLNLNEGSVIVFKKHNSEPLDILINNRRIGAGKTIKIGERFGVHVREVGTPQELLAKIR